MILAAVALTLFASPLPSDPAQRMRHHGGLPMNAPAASVVVNGERLAGAAIVLNNRVMVEMRIVFEKLGARVDYVARDRSIRAFTHNRSITMTIGQRMAMGSEKMMLDSPPVMRDTKVFVPLRAVSQAFDAAVSWDRATRTATVTTSADAMPNGGATTGGTTGGGV